MCNERPKSLANAATPGTDILLVAFPTDENWCCHIWSQYDNCFWRYHKKTVSTIITTIINDGTTTYLEICIRQKKSFTFVLRRNVFLLNALIIELTDVLLTVNFIKCYQAAIIMNK